VRVSFIEYTYQGVQDCNFVCCFLWVGKMVAHKFLDKNFVVLKHVSKKVKQSHYSP
jgi:hypothetical protein